jgi:hypothetical protein
VALLERDLGSSVDKFSAAVEALEVKISDLESGRAQ